MSEVQEMALPGDGSIEGQPLPIKHIRPTDLLREVIAVGREPLAAEPVPLFTGILREQHDAIFETAMAFARRRQIKFDLEQGVKVPESHSNSVEILYQNLVEKNFPGVDEEELGIMLSNYFIFIERGERILSRQENDDLLNASRMVNTFPVRGTRMGVIQPIKTTRVDSNASIRERMRRTMLKSQGGSENFSIFLPNSRIQLKAPIPTPWELASLINKIALELSGTQFGGRYRVSSLHLERALISRVMVNWLLDRCTYWSVSDVVSSEELLNLIELSDMGVIATAILAIGASKGVNYRMYCMADSCNFHEDVLAVPANLAHFDDVRYPPAYMEQAIKILDQGKRFTIQEMKDSRVPYVDIDGKEIDLKIPVGDGSLELNIDVPTLGSYFTCFDSVAQSINKEIRELAVQFSHDQDLFTKKRAELMASFRLVDHLQYFQSLLEKADPMVDGSEDILTTREQDQVEFNKGLMDMFSEDDELYGAALVKVITTIPRLSYTFIGIPDDHCPKCKKEADGALKQTNLGFTPIDPILNFFDQAQMLIAARSLLGFVQGGLLS